MANSSTRLHTVLSH